MPYKPFRFISQPIEVHFDRTPTLEKKTGCPDAFTWQEQTYRIAELLSEWHDYRRRGTIARNMAPAHAAHARLRGSWGVGQDYYRVRTAGGQVFDLYYDRSPKNVDARKGGWFIYQELIEEG